MNSFIETQHFRQWWLWTLLGVVFLITIVPLMTTEAGHEPFAWGGPIVTVLVCILMYVWRLDTRLDAEGIHYRVFPVFSWRTIPWTAIKSVSITKYSFVGYGIKLGPEGWIYNIAGNKGIRIVQTNNKRIIIGTQRPDDVQVVLKAHTVVSH